MQIYKPKIKTVALTMTIFIMVISSLWQGFCFSNPNKEAKPKDAALEHQTLPFKIGEKFLYQVHFNGIKVGKIE